MNAGRTANNIARWLRDYCDNHGKNGYVVGLSGGVDSATAAALAVRGIGRSKVLGVLMPCHSVEEDLLLGARAVSWLGIQRGQVDLAPVYDSMVCIGSAVPHAARPLAEANIKPRLRMIVLYYLAGALDLLVLGTGNKTELELGYFTKYGDGGVDVLPLGNLYKTQVWELAEYLGVPQEIIDRPPSAGLWEGQTDEGELGYSYKVLDGVLRRHIVEGPVFDLVAALRADAQHKLNMPPMGPGASQ